MPLPADWSPCHFTRAILRQPGASAVNGLRMGGGEDPTFAGVTAEHAAYAKALEAAGLVLTMLDPLEQFPDAMFVEDPALVFPGAALLLRPGAASRIGECELLRPELERHFETILDLPEGFVDGGDVLVMPDKVFIGLSARTDRQGAAALIGLLARIGLKGEAVESPSEVLHLKTASSLIDEETVLVTPALAASGIFDGYRLVITPPGEHAAANVLRANDCLFVGAGYPRTQDLLAGLGPQVVPLANSEIAKIDAGFTCMSLRW